MAIGKWIGGVLGWITTGSILGGLAGYCIGSLWDGVLNRLNDDDANGNTGGAGGYSGDANGYSRQGSGRGDSFASDHTRRQAFEGQRNSFLFSLLVLSSYIIKADGRVMHSEMEFVRGFFRQNFGEESVAQAQEILLRLFERQKTEGPYAFKETIRKSCVEMTMHLDYSARLQLFHYLVQIARADGQMPQSEVMALREVGTYLAITREDIESILNMSEGTRQSESDSLAEAYKVLGISPDATDAEVKAAYRKMALKHHPDRVAALGEDVRKMAERKLQEINQAKERIYKARGL